MSFTATRPGLAATIGRPIDAWFDRERDGRAVAILLLLFVAVWTIFHVVSRASVDLNPDYPEEHWRRIRTNNPPERILREIRRRARAVGAFPDGQSALNLTAARLRHIAGTAWSTKRYLNIGLLKDQRMRGAITA